tara:strand:- start:400 stop:1212 length:813 start_codon:yes stop_codon:yes gene_type:complete
MNEVTENSSSFEMLANLAIDPDVLAKELAAELLGDPLDEIDLGGFDSDEIKASKECEIGLKWLQQGHEERLQGLRVFCEYRDPRALPFLVPLLQEPCPVERMSAVYALGRNPCPRAVDILLNLLRYDSNAYVRKASAWSLGNYPDAPVLEPLIKSLQTDVAAVRLWASSSLADVGSGSTDKADVAAIQLITSLNIDSEPVVRSNCIWSLGRLYEDLSESRKHELVEGIITIFLNDQEPSVRDEARIVLEQINNPKIQQRVQDLFNEGLLL